MSTDLKPAHDVLLEMANDTCNDLKAVKKKMDSGESLFVDAQELYYMFAGRTALLVGLMGALEKMIIPVVALDAVVKALNKLGYVHAAIFLAARTLDERRRQVAVSAPTINTAHSSRAFEASPPWNPDARAPMQ
ncbi:MAG: hypothetical protein NUV88_01770 [Candidatus Kaiserbacteria bacterium]|nr:hypothetical protein [Candidatus Kaiserbacteria bacterium]